ncbi:hypothetical protein DRO28_00655 [Candidatus Bathyarchaeota archaeon]|nr:MAG: hypothetical protein DRO28_00655 [Candidatus Bathyarchaeota archaeon]
MVSKGLGETIRNLILYVSILSVIYIILTRESMIGYLNLNAEFIRFSLITTLALLLHAELSRRFIIGNKGKVLSLILSFFGFSFFAYSILEAANPKVDIKALAFPIILTILSLTSYKACREVPVTDSLKPFKKIVYSISSTLLSYCIWQYLSWMYEFTAFGTYTFIVTVADLGPLAFLASNIQRFYVTIPLSEVGRAVYLATSVTVTIILTTLSISELSSGVLAELSNFSEKHKLKIFSISLILGIYFFIVKPVLVTVLPSTNFLDWGFIGFVTLRFYQAMKRSTIDPMQEEDFQRGGSSLKRIKRRDSEDFERLKNLQRSFVSEGLQDPLIKGLTSFLTDCGFSRQDIAYIMAPLIEYEDEKTPLLPLSSIKRRIMKRNMKKREEVLRKVIDRATSLRGGINESS